MIAQVFNCNDSDFLNYLMNKYSISDFSISEKIALEIRQIERELVEKSYLILESFKNNIISYNSQKNKTIDIIFFSDSIEKIKAAFDGISRIKTNELINLANKALTNYANIFYKEYRIGGKIFKFNKPLLMGILNITPDSFSDGGKYFNRSSAVKKALEMVKEGADIIDIGGESTRPGSDPVSAAEESERIIPVIDELLSHNPDIIISVDTYKSAVARLALQKGAKIINDISSFTFDPEMADVCSEYNATVILMHIQGTPKTMQQNPQYEELISDIYNFLYTQTEIALSKGIQNIIIDPGIGFGKNVKDNFKILKRLNDFRSLGYPILIGLSRKSFIGKTLELGIEERDLPSSILETVSILNSARIIRTHNVRNGKQIIKLLSEII